MKQRKLGKLVGLGVAVLCLTIGAAPAYARPVFGAVSYSCEVECDMDAHDIPVEPWEILPKKPWAIE